MSMKIKRWVHASASHERSIGHGDFFYNSGNNDSYAMNAITGAPVSSIDLDNTIESDDSHDESFSDQSQFHESTANIMTNDVLEATCGNLNQK